MGIVLLFNLMGFLSLKVQLYIHPFFILIVLNCIHIFFEVLFHSIELVCLNLKNKWVCLPISKKTISSSIWRRKN